MLPIIQDQQGFRDFATRVIAEINEKIARSPCGDSIKSRRYIHFDRTQKFNGIEGCRLIDLDAEFVIEDDFDTYEQYFVTTYVGYVLKKLKERGVIYGFFYTETRGYFVQA